MEALKIEHSALENDLDEAETNLEHLQGEYDDLSEKYEIVLKDNDSLKEEVDQQKQMHKAIVQDFKKSQDDLLEYKKLTERVVEDLEKRMDSVKKETNGGESQMEKLGSMLSLTITGGDLHKSMEIQEELKRLKKRVEEEKNKAKVAEETLQKDRNMSKLQVQKLRSKLSRVAQNKGGDNNIHVNNLKKELSQNSAELQETKLELASIKRKYDLLVEAHSSEAGPGNLETSFSIGDIDRLTKSELQDRQDFINRHIATVLAECGYNEESADRIQVRMNDFSQGWWDIHDLVAACADVEVFASESLAFSGKKSHPDGFLTKLKEHVFFQKFSDHFGGD